MHYLEEEVRALIKKIYECEFTGFLKVEHRRHWYKLVMQTQYDPSHGGYTLMKECDNPSDFLKFVEEQFKKNNLMLVEHFKVELHGNHKC